MCKKVAPSSNPDRTSAFEAEKNGSNPFGAVKVVG